jgi:hypothetical protein
VSSKPMPPLALVESVFGLESKIGKRTLTTSDKSYKLCVCHIASSQSVWLMSMCARYLVVKVEFAEISRSSLFLYHIL